ncbi:MAG TPA: nucleotidyltransferase domain-containing protein [Bauldia sp.]|nr:nucleotidyltransferase domain-containing protein [Bauldia sp.]
MRKDVAIAKLKEQEAAIRALGATALYLFGSTARDEARPDSDIDVFIEYDPGSHFSLFELAGIEVLIAETLGVDAEVTTRNSLHPLLKKRIESSAIQVF